MNEQEGVQRTRSPVDLLLRVNRTHKRVIERRIAELGIHGGQHHMLMVLSHLGQIAAQNDLARRMDISPASAANMLKRLETGGYIERRAGVSDGRRNEVRITEKGGEMVERSKRAFEEVDHRMFEGFSGEEMERLRGALERILSNLRSVEDEMGGQEEPAPSDDEGNETTH